MAHIFETSKTVYYNKIDFHFSSDFDYLEVITLDDSLLLRHNCEVAECNNLGYYQVNISTVKGIDPKQFYQIVCEEHRKAIGEPKWLPLEEDEE